MSEENDDRIKTKQKWKMEIRHWLGLPKTGEWIRESVATDSKRIFERHTHGSESTKDKPQIVKVNVEELVYNHGCYRPKLDGEKATRKAFYFRGARVWREAA